jgi:hypothetical protein
MIGIAISRRPRRNQFHPRYLFLGFIDDADWLLEQGTAG